MRHVRYHELLPHEIVARRARVPVAFVPLATLEWHGEHLAVGLDGLKAERLCELAADRTGGFAFPTLWYGEPRTVLHMDADQEDSEAVRARMAFPEPEELNPPAAADEIELYQRLIESVLRQIHGFGMRVIVLVAGHYPLYDWVRPVVEVFDGQFPNSRATVGIESQFADAPRDPLPPLAEWLPSEEEFGSDHAATWETSYLWSLRPDCVNLGAAGDAPRLLGVLGDDPRQRASQALGARAVELTVAGMATRAAALLAELGVPAVTPASKEARKSS